jgi:autotransporter-associated beta strand protein
MVWTQPDSTSWNDTYYSGDSALFTGSGTGTVTISGTVTPLSVNVSAGNYTFSGDSLTTTGDIYVTSNGSLTLSSDVTVGNTRVFGLGTTTSASTSAMVVVSGVLNVGAGGGAVIIGGGAGTYQSGKGLLVINGGTVNVGAAGTTAQDVDASKLWLNAYGIGGDTGTIDLNGGMLSTARTIENGSIYGNAVVNLNGGTLQAAGAINLIAAAASNRRTTVNVLSGGAIIDTQAFNASISESLRDGGGGLTKNGTGKLTLTGANAYTGNTTINAGTLEVSGSLASTNIAVSATTTLVLLNTTCLSTNAVLSYAVGATNTLNYSGTQTVHAIYINGYPKPAGVYHSGNCPVLTGSGWLQTLYSPHPPGTLISFF